MKNKLKSGIERLANLIDAPAVILIYHRVTNLENDPQLLSVSPQNFERQIAVLRERCNLLPIEEFVDLFLKKKRFPERSVLITFDDGYADNLHEAAPILEKYDAQGLFYISTSLLDTHSEFWWDELERIFLNGEVIPPHLDIRVRNEKLVFSTATGEEKQATYRALHPLVKGCNVEERDLVMGQLISWSGLGSEGRMTHRVMTSAEVSQLAKSPSAIIGAHTHTHPRLSNCTRTKQFDEISTSKRILESLVNHRVEHFSYPFGSPHDYDRNSVNICRELEFKLASANYHSVLHRWHNRHQVPRILIRNWTDDEFTRYINRLF